MAKLLHKNQNYNKKDFVQSRKFQLEIKARENPTSGEYKQNVIAPKTISEDKVLIVPPTLQGIVAVCLEGEGWSVQ